jgi:hypothetical protein
MSGTRESRALRRRGPTRWRSSRDTCARRAFAARMLPTERSNGVCCAARRPPAACGQAADGREWNTTSEVDVHSDLRDDPSGERGRAPAQDALLELPSRGVCVLRIVEQVSVRLHIGDAGPGSDGGTAGTEADPEPEVPAAGVHVDEFAVDHVGDVRREGLVGRDDHGTHALGLEGAGEVLGEESAEVGGSRVAAVPKGRTITSGDPVPDDGRHAGAWMPQPRANTVRLGEAGRRAVRGAAPGTACDASRRSAVHLQPTTMCSQQPVSLPPSTVAHFHLGPQLLLLSAHVAFPTPLASQLRV